MTRSQMFRRSAIAGASALTLVVLAACGGDAPTDAAPDSNGGEDEPAPGGTLVQVAAVDADSLDPQQVTSVHAAMILSHLYDTLVVTDHAQEDIHPSLAESWEMSEDGLEYTFNLRDDVSFHSGKPLTSDDVVATLERWIDPDSTSPTRDSVESVESIEATGDHTVVITLSNPDNWFLTNLTMPWASILNADELDGDYGSTDADGTGPFSLGNWAPGDQMSLIRHEEYTWGPPIFDNPGPAFLEEITVRVIPEATTRLAALQAGEAQLSATGGDFLPYIDQIESDDSLETTVYDLMNVQFGGFKTAKPQLEDVRVRQAINHAIDKQTLIDVVENGLATVADGFLHPDMPYYWDGISEVAYDFDPERAEELLDEAGWEMGPDGVRERDGERLRIDAYAGTTSEESLVLVQGDLAQVGIEFVPNLVDRTALYDIRRSDTPDVNWIWLPYEIPDIIRRYFTCEQMPSPNRFDFCDEEFDELIYTALTSTDEEEIAEAYQEVQQVIHEEALAIPLYHRQEFITAADSLTGVEPFLQYGIGIFKSLDLTLTE